MAYTCNKPALLNKMLRELKPTKIDPQDGNKTIYYFESDDVVLCVFETTGTCQFQGKKGINSDLSKRIISIIETINKDGEE